MKAKTLVEQTVFGLDVSLAAPGVAVVSGNPRGFVGGQLTVEGACIRAGEDLRGPERLSIVSGAIWSWIVSRGGGKPGALYVQEGYAFSRSHAHSLGEIGGCVRRTIWESGGNLIVVPPSTLKRFVTGKGAGDKNVVMKHVYKRWHYDVDDDNRCDAFACAVLGLIDFLPEFAQKFDERDILVKKVERFRGKGQAWGPEPRAASSTRKARKKVS